MNGDVDAAWQPANRAGHTSESRGAHHDAMLDPSHARSAAFRRTLDEIGRVARDASAPILIEGESGTGKSILARWIHERSPRAGHPFEQVLLSALDDALAGSDLFGHVVGAFTDARTHRVGAFASSHRGSLFLDEIGKASLVVQRKLLHAVEYGLIRPLGADRDVRVDVRVICASNIALGELVASGTFLSDLHARLETFSVELPPLRSRRADIPLLVQAYLAHHAPLCGYPADPPTVDPALMVALQGARWPHNLRQLHATIRRLLIEAEGAPVVGLDHCRGTLAYLKAESRNGDGPNHAEIAAAMARANNNASLAARLLGIDRTTLYRRRRRPLTPGGGSL